MIISADEVRKRINHAGKAGDPFLFLVDFELKEGLFIDNPDNSKQLFWQFDNQSNKNFLKHQSKGSYFTPKTPPFEEYEIAFNRVYSSLRRGDSFLTNLTQRTPLTSDYTLQELFIRSNSKYAIYLPEQFVCFSPERFVRIEKGKIYSNPMKGTIDGSIPNADKIVLNDPKEMAEHYTIVDLIRSDLSRVASDVIVERLRYIDTLKTSKGKILQVSSEISGKLNDHFKENLGDTLFQLLPAGSVSGAPKSKTLRIIHEAEQINRGFYCGIAGYYDGKSFDSCVMIRFVEIENNNYYFRSGGGITINSNAKKEYEEIITKIYLPFI